MYQCVPQLSTDSWHLEMASGVWGGGALLCTGANYAFLNVDCFLKKDQVALKYGIKCAPFLKERQISSTVHTQALWKGLVNHIGFFASFFLLC